jgi:FKBP-type peptidyl-prolyl cis-trans isomerase
MANTELVKRNNDFLRMDALEVQEVSELHETLPKRIRSQVQYQLVQVALGSFVAMRKKIKAHYLPFKRSAQETVNLLRGSEREDLKPCESGEQLCQILIRGWEQEREAKAQKQLQAAMKKAEEEAQQKRDRELAQLEAEKAQADEDTKTVLSDVADTLKAQPLAVDYTPVKQPYSRPQGHSVRHNYRAEVVNLKMLIQAVARGDADLQCLQANMTYLNSKARQEKEQLSIPGVAPVKTLKTVVRS